jgi:glycine cleavage system transcriptional repressor
MSGRRWFAIAAIGRDRPGIVADLSECAYACGCNLEDASMTMLGSEFATLMLISAIEDDAQERLADAFRRLEWERQLSVFVRPLEGAPTPTIATDAVPYRLVAEGVDKAGIVARISRCLADRGIHIADLRSHATPVPESGTPVYTLTLRMNLPPESVAELASLRGELAAIAHDLRVDVSIEPLED